MKKISGIFCFAIIVFFILTNINLYSQTLSPKVTPSGGGYATSGGNSLSWTMGETFYTTTSAGNIILSQGQQQPEIEIITTGLSTNSLCAGAALDVQYSVAGYYGASNTFTAQLSDAAGSFSAPVNIGSLASVSGGTINCVVPVGTPAGNNYTVRIISNHPSYTGKKISSSISIGGSSAAAPSSLTGSPVACPGTTGNAYSTPLVAGAANYIWSGSAGITVVGSGQNVTVNFSAGFTSGNLCVNTLSACGINSANYCMNISRSTAQPGTISGGNACPNSSTVFSITPVANAVSYNWTCSVPGAVITPGGTSCSVLFPASIANGSNVCVTAVSACGYASAQRCKTLSTGAPAKPASITGQGTGLCGAANIVYTVSNVAAATSYFWTVNGGAIIVGPNNLSSVNINFPASFNNITISAAAVNNCGTGMAKTISVQGAVFTPSSISGNTSVCNGVTETYTANGSVGATSFTWTKPPSATIIGPANGSTISILWGANGGNVTAKANNSCGTSGKATLNVSISCRNAQDEIVPGGAEVFPNPATERITVKLNCRSDEENIRLQLTDLTGQILLSEDVKAVEGINLHEVDITAFASGIYFIHLVSEGRHDAIKVVVDR